MPTDRTKKLHRLDRWLAVLNFLLAGPNALLWPCSAFGWYFAWSMNDTPGSQSPPEALPLFACMSAVVVLSGSLCLGFVAGVGLLKGQPMGRTVTILLMVLAGLHLLFEAALMVVIAVTDPLKMSEAGIRAWLQGIISFGPSLVYCLAVPILLSLHNRLRPSGGHSENATAEILQR